MINNKVEVTVTDKEVAKGHNTVKRILEIDRGQNKGIARKVTNGTVAKRLIMSGVDSYEK